MPDLLLLSDCSRSVLEKVLDTTFEIVSDTDEGAEPEPEKVIATLKFSGDYIGSVCLVLYDRDIHRVVHLILKRFGIDLPVEPDIIFTEVLNIFGGNLITELEQHKINISIETPKLPEKGFTSSKNMLEVKLLSQDRLMFKLCYSLRESC